MQNDDFDAFSSAFSLDSRSGQFTLSKRLDYETDLDQYIFYVEASDGKFKSVPVKVVFNLVNLPDNPPTFDASVYKVEVAENKLFDNILCLKATDADLNNQNSLNHRNENSNSLIQNLTYQFELDGLKSIEQSFKINQSTGCISIVKPLDREEFANIDLTAIVDDGYFNATAFINVRVLDDNDNYPVFDKKTPKVIRIEENIAVDSIVYSFSATDLDELPNSYIKYELINSDPEKQSNNLPFVIGSIDGQLRVTGLIDRESIDSYDIIVRANDYGLKYTDFACRIEIEDVIDNFPVFEKNYYEIDVFENMTVGENIFKLHALDADETDEINYKIISGDDFGYFCIEDDFIMLAMNLDYEEINVYTLKINAIDKGGNLDTMNIKLNVLNILDERPVFTDSPYNFNWFENQVGIIGKFEASSESKILNKRQAMSHNNINYLLLNNFNDTFRVNSTNAIISVISPIDRESLIQTNPDAIIELKIIAIDSRSRLSSEALVYIHIEDDNDNEPYFTSDSYTFQLNENQFYHVNSTIGKVEAIDLDQSDVLNYELFSNYEDKFSIDRDGRIYLNSSIIFDREEQEVYEMTVYVSDNRHSISTAIKVVFNDVNDCTPVVTKINNIMLTKHNMNSLNEFKLKMPINKLISILNKKFPLIGLQIIDCDAGLNGQIQVRMNNAELYSLLKIDERNAVIKSDYKNIQRDSLQKISNIDITVNDCSELNQLSSVYSIKLDFTDVDSYRESSLVNEDFIELRLSESTSVNETLYKFEISQTISEINIYAGDVYNHFMVVDNKLILLRPLDYEKIKSYDLYLQAINHQKDFEDFQYIFVRINVLNENDNPPMFLHDIYNASIFEEEDRIFVTQVIANDIDQLDTKIKYQILNADNLPFLIEPNSGNIWTTTKIDREIIESFSLIVSAEDEDGLRSTCRVNVQIGLLSLFLVYFILRTNLNDILQMIKMTIHQGLPVYSGLI